LLGKAEVSNHHSVANAPDLEGNSLAPDPKHNQEPLKTLPKNSNDNDDKTRDGRACLLLGEAEVADFDGRAGGIAQVGQQVVALEVKVDHMPAVQILHACIVKIFRAKPISASNLTQYTRIVVAPT
jgi:hypothetical protein